MKHALVFGFFLLFLSCTKDVDFNQIDDVEIKSKYIASLAHFDLVSNDFIDDDSMELPSLEDFVMPGLRPSYVENVLKMEFTFEFSNSFSRDFYATVYFFDSDGNIVYQLDPTIEVLKNSEAVQTVVTVVPPDIETIYSAHKAGFSIELVSDENEMLTPDTPGNLNLKSSLTLYLNVEI